MVQREVIGLTVARWNTPDDAGTIWESTLQSGRDINRGQKTIAYKRHLVESVTMLSQSVG